MTDQELDALVRDAYDSFGPTDEAHDRVLAALRNAQSAQPAQPAQPEQPVQATQPVQSTQPARKAPVLRLWWVALPVAACLALALVVVRIQAPATSATTSSEAALPTATESNKSDSYAEPIGEDFASETEADGVAFESADEAAYESADKRALVVTLEDGTTFEVGDPLDEEPTYDKIEDAEVDGRRCKVADRAYVHFEDDDTWYELIEY